MAVDGFGDVFVPGAFLGPSSLVGIVAEDDDVGELSVEDVLPVVVGDVVVALLTDVGVGAGAGGEVAAAVAVSDSGLVPIEELPKRRRAVSSGVR